MVILSRSLRRRRPCPKALSARPLVSEDVCSRPGLAPEGAHHRFVGTCSSFVGRIPPGRGAVVGRPVVASSRGVDARCGAVERGDATCPGSPVAWLVVTRRRLGAGRRLAGRSRSAMGSLVDLLCRSRTGRGREAGPTRCVVQPALVPTSIDPEGSPVWPRGLEGVTVSLQSSRRAGRPRAPWLVVSWKVPSPFPGGCLRIAPEVAVPVGDSSESPTFSRF